MFEGIDMVSKQERKRPGTDLVLDLIVVDGHGHGPIIQITGYCAPAFSIVIDCLGCSSAIGHLVPVGDQPDV